MKKRLFAVLLILTLCLCLLSACAQKVDSGEWGEGLTWTIYDDGSLVIKGSGPMDSCIYGAPWNDSEFPFQTVTVKEGVTSVSGRAFADNEELISVALPAGIEDIESEAFSGCAALSGITLGEGLTAIGDRAFSGCAALTEIALPESLTDIGAEAFKNSGLTAVDIPAGVTQIRENTFDSCQSLTAVGLPEGLTAIGDYAFSACVALTDVVLPDSVKEIGTSAFYACSSLPEIDIPAGVTEIPQSAFKGCSSLARVGIPEGVTVIRDYAFMDCSALTEVVLPKSMTALYFQAFSGCSSLLHINISPDLEMLSLGSLEGTAFEEKLKEFLPASYSEGLDSRGVFTLLGSDDLHVVPIDSYGVLNLDMYSLLPEGVGTLDWEDADYALMWYALYEQRNDYYYVDTGEIATNVYNTRSALYLTDREGNCTRLTEVLKEPGYGALYGATVSYEELWENVKDLF